MIGRSVEKSSKKKRKSGEMVITSMDNLENTSVKVTPKKMRRNKKVTNQKSEESTTSTKTSPRLKENRDIKLTNDSKESFHQKIIVEENNEKPKPISKRQAKKERIEKREAAKKELAKKEAAEKAVNYILKWKHAKNEWKFEKLKQIWLIDHMLDESSIPDSLFPTVVEYFEGCKGMAREQVLKQGLSVIKKVEEEKEEDRENAIESKEYKRARQLLQALPM